ncbi:hypothetical protein QLQ85_15025 [Halomonas sp. M4R5S39]|uniref:hypothetical protein n=1 Tax=Halomonas kalidii TaxID=3043293 RepID=UPI0024A8C90A|nr:hypothetical protein [Halomonas kalidii]MDI5986108.1 hypothetical protein [Halomonas kalidii]
MHGKTARSQHVSHQANQHSILSCFQAPEAPYHMALRSLSEDLSPLPNVEKEVLSGKAVYQERIALTPRFRSNLARFAGIVLPRESATLELQIITPVSLAQLDPTGSISSIGNWSILMEDEASRLALWLLNINARHFLEYARPDRFSGTAARLESFREFMRINEFKCDEVVLVSSIVLEIYGLRKADDIDYLALGEEKFSMPGIESQDSHLFYHCLSKQELITNPDWHFQIDGIRFVSLSQLKKFKKNRRSPHKDCHDVGMMEALESGSCVGLWRHRVLHKLCSIYLRSRKKSVRALRSSSLYSLVRSICRTLGGS